MSGRKPDQERPDRPLPDPPVRLLMRGFAWAALLFVLLMLGAGGWLAWYALTPASPADSATILIPRGAGVRQISTLLARQNLLKDDIRFAILARLTGTAHRLRAGEYLIPPQQTPLQILRLLEKGEVILHPVTLPEGLRISQLADILAEKGWVDRSVFLELTSNPEFIKKFGINQDNLEGYLFPDTYLLTRGDMTEEDIITMMVNRFHRVWTEIATDMPAEMNRHQVITLASIVEKETGTDTERPVVAGVFFNRLRNKMRLQSDPTVIFGIETFDGNLTKKHLVTDTPYNTYTVTGLPPGPICNPGRESIKAVLFPANVPYFFFVSKNDGTHHFSTTLAEHNSAVREYQKRR